MNESFLHYIWQHQYFNRVNLKTLEGDTIQVFNPGTYNRNAGPDFLESKIKIDSVEWAGSVEIHLKSSDYQNHRHQINDAYNNVVLHVVWKNDKKVLRSDGTAIPTLELRERVDGTLLKQYNQLVNSGFQIPCSNSFSRVKPLTVVSMIEQAAVQRLNSKAAGILKMYQENNGDWEETFFQVLAKNFGFKVNADPFFTLAKTASIRLIRKTLTSLTKVEALLFGLAGFLESKKGDDYYNELKNEFEYQSQKFNLAQSKMSKAQWKFLRLRPANFPTIRLAQLASVLVKSTPMFEKILEADNLMKARRMFSTSPSNYWQTHYSFGKENKNQHGNLGDDSIDNLLINSLIPTLVAVATQKCEAAYFNRAIEFLQQIKPETNAITREWQSLNVKAVSALDSQGLIEQMNISCTKRNCLNCSIGTSLLKPER